MQIIVVKNAQKQTKNLPESKNKKLKNAQSKSGGLDIVNKKAGGILVGLIG